MARDPALLAVVLVIAGLFLYSPVATVRAWKRYLADPRKRWDPFRQEYVHDRSFLLLLLAVLCSLTTVGLGIVTFVAIRRIFVPDRLFADTPYTLGLAIALLGLVPVIIDRVLEAIADADEDLD